MMRKIDGESLMICGMRVDLSSFAFNIQSSLSISKFNATAAELFPSEKSHSIDKSSRGKKNRKGLLAIFMRKTLLRKHLFLSRSTSRRQQLCHQINFQHEGKKETSKAARS
jgi:hypothetical protein